MSQEIRFLTIEDVLRLHAFAIEDQGGDPSMRDRGLLESALAMPRQQFGGEFLHTGIPAMAAAYAFHICKNHAFIDGNKRAATAAMIAFLSDNGWSFDAQADVAEPVILALASGSLGKDELTAWVAAQSHEKTKMELRNFFIAVSHQALTSQVFALAEQFRQSEWEASFREAADAMPFLSELDTLAEITRNDPSLGVDPVLFEGIISNFVALYRIAEDMGYEW